MKRIETRWGKMRRNLGAVSKQETGTYSHPQQDHGSISLNHRLMPECPVTLFLYQAPNQYNTCLCLACPQVLHSMKSTILLRKSVRASEMGVAGHVRSKASNSSRIISCASCWPNTSSRSHPNERVKSRKTEK